MRIELAHIINNNWCVTDEVVCPYSECKEKSVLSIAMYDFNYMSGPYLASLIGGGGGAHWRYLYISTCSLAEPCLLFNCMCFTVDSSK